MRLLVTGGAGFIGSNFVRSRLDAGDEIAVIDKLTYAGHLENLEGVLERVRFVEADICDADTVRGLVGGDLDAVVNFAAETHVDRSIEGAAEFIRANVTGVQVLLDAVADAGGPRLCQVSTDEVYGSAGPGEFFTEDSRLRPSNPYAASKAAADLLCLGYHATHGTPVVVTRCTNNYGPRQYPEKLIPFFLMRAAADEELPLYGDGLNERDWLYVDDHCRALEAVIGRGRPGEVYNISAGSPVPNRDVVSRLLAAVGKGEELIRLVSDRPGHDRRYAIDSTKLRTELGWEPQVSLDEGLERTVAWYRAGRSWIEAVTGPDFAEHCRKLYGGRPGAGA